LGKQITIKICLRYLFQTSKPTLISTTKEHISNVIAVKQMCTQGIDGAAHKQPIDKAITLNSATEA